MLSRLQISRESFDLLPPSKMMKSFIFLSLLVGLGLVSFKDNNQFFKACFDRNIVYAEYK